MKATAALLEWDGDSIKILPIGGAAAMLINMKPTRSEIEYVRKYLNMLKVPSCQNAQAVIYD
ncbi:MAG: hypothetical protein PHF37_04100 [Phycisphaerae bacterium]|nr:hypothetical protein [Phycisphaerae bacterium]